MATHSNSNITTINLPFQTINDFIVRRMLNNKSVVTSLSITGSVIITKDVSIVNKLDISLTDVRTIIILDIFDFVLNLKHYHWRNIITTSH